MNKTQHLAEKIKFISMPHEFCKKVLMKLKKEKGFKIRFKGSSRICIEI